MSARIAITYVIVRHTIVEVAGLLVGVTTDTIFRILFFTLKTADN